MFISPNAPDIRKFLIFMISRLSMGSDQKGAELEYTYEDRIANERAKHLATNLKKWKNTEWILPELLNLERCPYHTLDLPIGDLKYINILKAFPSTDTNLKRHLFNSLVSRIHKHEYEVVRAQQYASVKAETISVEKKKAIVTNNKEAWASTKRYVPRSILKTAEPGNLEIGMKFN